MAAPELAAASADGTLNRSVTEPDDADRQAFERVCAKVDAELAAEFEREVMREILLEESRETGIPVEKLVDLLNAFSAAVIAGEPEVVIDGVAVDIEETYSHSHGLTAEHLEALARARRAAHSTMYRRYPGLRPHRVCMRVGQPLIHTHRPRSRRAVRRARARSPGRSTDDGPEPDDIALAGSSSA